MMKELQDDVKGIIIGGKNYTSLRFADDAVFVSDEEAELQTIITRLGEICKEYGMEVNVAFSKAGNMPCIITSDGTVLEQKWTDKKIKRD